jgi:hypothetical protein
MCLYETLVQSTFSFCLHFAGHRDVDDDDDVKQWRRPKIRA